VKVIVVYDVSEEYEEERRELRELLESLGGRWLQYSVYMVETTEKGVERILRKAREIARRREATIHVIPVCERCLKGVKQIGIPRRRPRGEAPRVL